MLAGTAPVDTRSIGTAHATEPFEPRWRGLYQTGAVFALVVLAGTVLDIALTMMPGWDPTTVPADAAGWFAQFAGKPLLAIRNLDFLNAMLSVIGLPLYAALLVAHRHTAPAIALVALLAVALGTALFASANAALPMLELSGRYAAASDSGRVALEAAAESLLARGAHGSYGAFPGFILSEVGTLLMSAAMLVGGVFSKRSAWVGIVGMGVMVLYSVAFTFGVGSDVLIMAVAAPAGLLMLSWYVMVARRLLEIATTGDA
jgi:hypothetical protein